jgi:transcription elongation factor GreA
MATERFPITKAGYEKMQSEIKHLKTVERPAIISAISDARELGDLSENAEYHSAKEKQGFIEGRIQDLEDKFARAEVINIERMNGTLIKFGATVTLVDEENGEESVYQIVSEYEADLAQGKISLTSPIARGMIGKDEGDSIEVFTPKGVRIFEVIKVQYIG